MAPEDDKDGAHSRSELPGGADEYVRDSIRASLGLPVPDRSLRLQLLASEDLRRRLQDHVFALEEDLHAAARRIDLLKVRPPLPATAVTPSQSHRYGRLTCGSDHPVSNAQKESAMNAEGIRRCVEEKEAVAADRGRLDADAARLEKEVTFRSRS
jgi:hypothetical protein